MRLLPLLLVLSSGCAVQPSEPGDLTICDCWFEQVQLDICSRPLILECRDPIGESLGCLPDPSSAVCYQSIDPYVMCCWPDVEPLPVGT